VVQRRSAFPGKDDGLVTVRPVRDRVSCFADLVTQGRDEAFAALRRGESTGRPVGTAEVVIGLERVLGRRIAPRAPGSVPEANRSTQGGTMVECPDSPQECVLPARDFC
jgi:putative transposase